MDDLTQLVSKLKISANIPPPATNFQHFETGLSNIYIFETKPGPNFVYRYDVEITDVARDKSLTNGAGDDGKRGLMSDICYDIVRTAHESTNGFDSNDQALFIYDNRKILFTNVEVKPMAYEITSERMSPFCRKFLKENTVSFQLQPCKKSFKLNLGDITNALQQSAYEQADHTYRTFFEMLTTQPFINMKTHKIVGAGRIFEVKESKRLTEAITTHRGLAKGVRIISNGEVPCPALVADVKMCAFFVADNLGTIASSMLQAAQSPQNRRRLDRNDPKQMEMFWNDFGHLFKGVSASLTYAPWRVIVIDCITTRNCSEFSFEVNGNKMTMVDFFRTKKNVTIDPNIPAVRQHVDRDSVYPLACLEILPFQRLSLDKMALNDQMGQISRELLVANAVGPAERYKAIENEMRKIGAEGDCAKFMRQFNVRMKASRNDVQIGLMVPPKIVFGRNQEPARDNKGRFDVRGPMQYVEPTKGLKTWMVAHARRIGEQQIGKFVSEIIQTGRRRGMELPAPIYELMEFNQIEEKMELFKSKDVQFLLYIDNKYIKSHAPLKLYERKFSLLTQHVTIEMIQKAGIAAISQVLNKINMKNSGLNHLVIPAEAAMEKFDLTSGDVLVIGFDTSRPARATAFELFKLSKSGMEGMKSEDPMVVGLCANFDPNPVKFLGDYYYQPCRQDVLDPHFLEEKMVWLLQQVKACRKAPKTIFIIRDGVSEGMIQNVVTSEFDAIVKACKRFAPQWQPKFVYSVVDKTHNKRFFVKQQNGQGSSNGIVAANTMPGSVIDRKFVRVDMHEFFLQAHYPLKGASKIPQYIFPINQVNADNNELQAFLYSLCNMWQIVNLAPALPTPVLQAKELAKRGRANYVEFKRSNSQHLPFVQGDPNLSMRMLDFTRLNQMLCYGSGSSLVKTRFNA